MWHMGMRPIGGASPIGCGPPGADSTAFYRQIPDSQAILSGLSAGDGDRHRLGESCPESGLFAFASPLSPIRLRQSRISPRDAVG